MYNGAARPPFVFLLLALVLALGGFTPSPQPLDRSLRQIVEDPAAPLASLAVAIVAGNEIVYEGYFGARTIDAQSPQRSLPVNAATKFRVASISKAITAIGAMQLVEQGKLDLDADVSRYLGFRLRNPSYPQRPITARMLLSHTSSLRDAGLYNLPSPYTLRDLLLPGGAYYDAARFAQSEQHADRGPGAYFTYANLNYGVLGTVMEAAAGERFDRYMARHLLIPLGIDGGYTLGSLSDAAFSDLATLYTKQNEQGLWNPKGAWYAQADDYGGTLPQPQPPMLRAPQLNPQAHAQQAAAAPAVSSRTPGKQPYVPGTNATLFSPHAGLRISARDLARLLLVLLAEGRVGGAQLLRETTVRQMLREGWRYSAQQPNGDTSRGRYRAWGLGLQHTTATQDALGGDLLAVGDRGRYWGHRGEAYGFLGGMWFDPQREIGFVYLIGGLGDDPYLHPGEYSSAYAWEEKVQTAILDEISRRKW